MLSKKEARAILGRVATIFVVLSDPLSADKAGSERKLSRTIEERGPGLSYLVHLPAKRETEPLAESRPRFTRLISRRLQNLQRRASAGLFALGRDSWEGSGGFRRCRAGDGKAAKQKEKR